MIPSTNLDETQTIDKILQHMFPNGGTNIKLLAPLLSTIQYDNNLETFLPQAIKTPMFISCFLEKLLRHFHPTVDYIPSGQALHEALITLHSNLSFPTVHELVDMSEEEQEEIVSELLKLITEISVSIERRSKKLRGKRRRPRR